jgi:succinate dehydrogenase/fumarate reductase-like Fe-S protein
MTRDGASDPIGFGSGISTDHKDGIRWVDYSNISWNPVFCKRCDICVEICPKEIPLTTSIAEVGGQVMKQAIGDLFRK